MREQEYRVPRAHGPKVAVIKAKLEDYLENRIFGELAGETIAPCEEDKKGFDIFMERYKAGLAIEKKAIEVMKW